MTYWNDEFGIKSLEQFTELAGRFLPTLRWWGVGFTQEQTARFAYEHPYSGPGTVANALLVVRALYGADAVKERALVAAQTGYWNLLTGAAGRFIDGSRMPQLIIPGVVQVAIVASSGGQDVINVVGVRKGGGTTVQAVEAVRTAWTSGTSNPLSLHTNSYQMVEYRGMDLSTANGDIVSVAGTGAGSNTTQNATNAASALVKFNGGTRSASSRGRLYFGPLHEAQINADGRTLVSAQQTALTTSMNGFRTSLETAGNPLCVISRLNSSATNVTSLSVASVIATQRRRIR